MPYSLAKLREVCWSAAYFSVFAGEMWSSTMARRLGSYSRFAPIFFITLTEHQVAVWLITRSGYASTICPGVTWVTPALVARIFSAMVWPIGLPGWPMGPPGFGSWLIGP